MTGMEKPLVVQCRPLLCPWKDLSVALGVLGQQQQWLDAIHLLQSLGGVDWTSGDGFSGSMDPWELPTLKLLNMFRGREPSP